MYINIVMLMLQWFSAGIECNPIKQSFSMLKVSEEKTDIKDIIPLLQFLQKPQKEETKIASLLYQLGEDYDSEYTSVVEPDSMKARDPGAMQIINNNAEKDEELNPVEMTDEFKSMKFMLTKNNGKKKELGKKSTHKFQQWLWDLSQCPVKYKWIDLGENIFPRYVKRGTCLKKKTCSFPAGMRCEKSKWKTLTVLIYTCLHEINSVGSNCKWRNMSLDVLTECSCGCKK